MPKATKQEFYSWTNFIIAPIIARSWIRYTSSLKRINLSAEIAKLAINFPGCTEYTGCIAVYHNLHAWLAIEKILAKIRLLSPTILKSNIYMAFIFR